MKHLGALLLVATGLTACGPSAPPPNAGKQVADAGLPRPYIIADAGDAYYAPEETMIAMRNAVRLGADVIEADANMTADNVIVLIHDGTLDRTTNCTGNVKDRTWAQIKDCDAAYWWVPGIAPGVAGLVNDPSKDASDGRDYALRGKGVHLATAEEFLQYVASLGPRMPQAYLEIKNIPYDSNFDPQGTRIADVLVPLIEKYGLADRVGVESFWPESLARVKELNPRIKTVFLTLGSASENYAYVAQSATDYSSSDTLAPDYGQTYVDNVHALGRQVTPWLVDTLADAANALAYGVDGVYTSHVACMLQGFGRSLAGPIVTPEAGVNYDLDPCNGHVIPSQDPKSAIARIRQPGGAGLTANTGTPVLLIHGTDSNSVQSWATTYVPALSQAGFDVYTLDLPARALDDIQLSAEYTAEAIRHINAQTGRKLSIVAHSQGGLEPRWALRFFPDLAGKVDDVISLGTPQHGTEIANANCLPGCPPSNWQMAVDSGFLAALNRDGTETPGGASYTSLYSANDELVQPQAPESTSALAGASNVLVQSVCPNHPVEHVALMRDPVVYALVLDALTHAGGADPSRIDPGVCAQAVIPGVDPVAQFKAEYWYGYSFTDDAANYNVTEEPPLRDYAK